jgi:hypothetical protein
MASAAFDAGSKSVAQTTRPNDDTVTLPVWFPTAGTIRTGLLTRWMTRSATDPSRKRPVPIRVQHDDAGRVSGLHAHPETDAFRFGGLSERCDMCHPRASTKIE